MVNCDLGHCLFIDKGRIKFFCDSGEKTRIFWLRSGWEIRAFWSLTGILTSEAKLKMVNCNLGHSYFMAKGHPNE